MVSVTVETRKVIAALEQVLLVSLNAGQVELAGYTSDRLCRCIRGCCLALGLWSAIARARRHVEVFESFELVIWLKDPLQNTSEEVFLGWSYSADELGLGGVELREDEASEAEVGEKVCKVGGEKMS